MGGRKEGGGCQPGKEEEEEEGKAVAGMGGGGGRGLSGRPLFALAWVGSLGGSTKERSKGSDESGENAHVFTDRISAVRGECSSLAGGEGG